MTNEHGKDDSNESQSNVVDIALSVEKVILQTICTGFVLWIYKHFVHNTTPMVKKKDHTYFQDFNRDRSIINEAPHIL